MLNKLNQLLRSKKGSGIVQFIIVVAIVGVIAVTTIPNLMSKVEEKASTSVDRIDDLDSIME
jgi:competence protein ComGC